MMKRIKRMSLALIVGVGILVGVIWLLGQTLGDHETLYQGKSSNHWREQLVSRDTAASNQANVVLNAQIIPQLTEQMFHDTNDSSFRAGLIEKLNTLPGVQINFTPADGRRARAASELGEFGPPAKAAIPDLIQALKGKDSSTRGNAIGALGKIHGEPDVVIPLLIAYLDDQDLNDEAAEALGNFGSLSRGAVPKLLPLLKANDKDVVAAAIEALKKIDPEVGAKAEIDMWGNRNASTNQPHAVAKPGIK